MTQTTLYQYCDENHVIRYSSDPIPLTRAFLRYRLRADKGKILYNTKTARKLKVAIVAPWDLENWTEIDR